MGLSIQVGVLGLEASIADHFCGDFDKIRRELRRERLGQWDENPNVDVADIRPHVDSFPYNYFDLLRRAYTLVTNGRTLTPTDYATDEEHELMGDLAEAFTSHLLSHYDTEGYYVPVDFPEPLYLTRVTGDFVGSSFRLKQELRFVAPFLGVELDSNGDVPLAVYSSIEDESGEEDFHCERVAFLALWEATRTSILQSTAIAFL